MFASIAKYGFTKKGKYTMNKRNFFSFFLSTAMTLGSVNAMELQHPDNSQNSSSNTPANSVENLNPVNEVLSYSFRSPYTQENATIQQGAILLSSRSGIIGSVSTATNYLSGVFNPNNVNDASPIVLAHWKDLQNLQSTNQYFGNAMRSLRDRAIFYNWEDNDIIPCVVSLSGYNVSLGDSFVSLIPLDQKILSSNGSVFYRNLNNDVSDNISYNLILDVLADVVGKPSEDFRSLKEVFFAPLDKNTEENTEKFFNSELAAYFYKVLGLIDSNTNCSNVVPPELSSGAGSRDLLYNIAAGIDTPLKLSQASVCGKCLLQ